MNKLSLEYMNMSRAFERIGLAVLLLFIFMSSFAVNSVFAQTDEQALLKDLEMKAKQKEKEGQFKEAYILSLKLKQIKDSLKLMEKALLLKRKELELDFRKKEEVHQIQAELTAQLISIQQKDIELSKEEVLIRQNEINLNNAATELLMLEQQKVERDLVNRKLKAEKMETGNIFDKKRLQLLAQQNKLQKATLISKGLEKNILLVCVFILAGIAVLFIVNYRKQRKSNLTIENTNNELSATLLQLKELQAKLIEEAKNRDLALEKARISRDIHDDLGSGLTSISIMSEMLKVKHTKYADQIDEISRISAELVDNMSQIVWAMNPENDKLENLFGYLRKYCAEFLENAGIEFSLVMPDNIRQVQLAHEVRRNLFLVIRESIKNILKHSTAGKVGLIAEKTDNILSIKIVEDGLGFEFETARTRGYGLNLLKKHVEEVMGKLSVNRLPHGGTELKIEIAV